MRSSIRPSRLRAIHTLCLYLAAVGVLLALYSLTNDTVEQLTVARDLSPTLDRLIEAAGLTLSNKNSFALLTADALLAPSRIAPPITMLGSLNHETELRRSLTRAYFGEVDIPRELVVADRSHGSSAKAGLQRPLPKRVKVLARTRSFNSVNRQVILAAYEELFKHAPKPEDVATDAQLSAQRYALKDKERLTDESATCFSNPTLTAVSLCQQFTAVSAHDPLRERKSRLQQRAAWFQVSGKKRELSDVDEEDDDEVMREAASLALQQVQVWQRPVLSEVLEVAKSSSTAKSSAGPCGRHTPTAVRDRRDI